MTILTTLECIIDVTQQQLAWGWGDCVGFVLFCFVLFNLLISLKRFVLF